MKRSRYLTVVICVSFLAVVFLSGLVRNVRGEEGKPAVREGYSEEREEYRKKAKVKLAEFDRKMEELEVKAKKAGSEAKAEADKGLRELKEKRAALKEEMEKLEASGKETWATIKRKVNDAMDDLEKTYDKVRSRFKSE